MPRLFLLSSFCLSSQIDETAGKKSSQRANTRAYREHQQGVSPSGPTVAFYVVLRRLAVSWLTRLARDSGTLSTDKVEVLPPLYNSSLLFSQHRSREQRIAHDPTHNNYNDNKIVRVTVMDLYGSSRGAFRITLSP